VVREKENGRGKEYPLFAVCFTVVSSASFSIGVDCVKQRLMKPVWVSIYQTRNDDVTTENSQNN
jgi:hypothetical protein